MDKTLSPPILLKLHVRIAVGDLSGQKALCRASGSAIALKLRVRNPVPLSETVNGGDEAANPISYSEGQDEYDLGDEAEEIGYSPPVGNLKVPHSP